MKPRQGAVCVLVVALSTFSSAVPATAVGELTQKAGTAGCISESGTGGTCQDGAGLNEASAMAVSPDGASAYVAAGFSNAVAVFDRNPTTGALTQKGGTAGCVSETGTGGACQDGRALDRPNGVAVSPDGTSVYVSSELSSSVAVFDRDPATGALTQKAGTLGCVSDDGTGGFCQDGNALSATQGLTVSPDGRSVYAVSFGPDAVAVFDRDPATGALTQKAAAAGCISDTGGGGCQNGNALDGPAAVAVSADGASVYVPTAYSDSVAVFDRNPATGALTQKAGTAGCVSDTGTGGTCQDGTALDAASGVAISPDGASVYVTSYLPGAVAVFDRNPGTGALAQKAGTAGCISDTGGSGTCQDGNALGGASDVTVSPDGASAYVTSSDAPRVVLLDRDPATGALTQKAGAAGCLSDTGTGGTCQVARALGSSAKVAVAPDGTSLYVVSPSPSAVAVFDRLAGRPGNYTQLMPARLLDTRNGTGAPIGPVTPGSTLDLQVLGRGGVPATGVSAVVLNVTVTGPTQPGYITVHASGSPRPTASNVNFRTGQTTANAVVAPVGANGKVALFNGSAGTTHLITDVSGYVLADNP